MYKRKIGVVLSIIFLIATYVGLNEIISFDGYYRTIEQVNAHEKKLKKSEEIARIKNGESYFYVFKVNDAIRICGYKTKDTFTGKKYAVAFIHTTLIDYKKVSDTYPDIGDWRICKKTIFTNSNEKTLYWHIVKKDDNIALQNNIMKYEYTHDNCDYYFLCVLKNDNV